MKINWYEIKHTTWGTNYRVAQPDWSTVDIDALAYAGLLWYVSQFISPINKSDLDTINHKLDAIIATFWSFSKSLEKLSTAVDKNSSSLEKLSDKIKSWTKKAK